MSRIAKKPIIIPDKTKVSYDKKTVVVTGQKGTLSRVINELVDIKIDKNLISVLKLNDSREAKAMSGLTWVLIDNMITGTSKGFERNLEINGIGYKAELKGKDVINFSLGYSHPVNFKLPNGITAEVDKVKLKLMGIDKELLGKTVAAIRELRPPEPYKGKGVKYSEERIRRKAGKASSSGKK